MAEKNCPIEVFYSIFFTPPRWADAAFVWRRPDAWSAHKTAHVGTTRPTQRSKWLRRCAFPTCAIVQPLVLRLQAALGSGFSLQAAFWYQNAMLALFLCSKKSQSVVRFSFRLEDFFDFHFAQAMKSKISAFRISQSLH